MPMNRDRLAQVLLSNSAREQESRVQATQALFGQQGILHGIQSTRTESLMLWGSLLGVGAIIGVGGFFGNPHGDDEVPAKPEDAPLDTSEKPKSWMDRLKDFVSGAKKDAAAEPSKPEVPNTTVSPLLKGVSIPTFKTGDASDEIRQAIVNGARKANADPRLLYALAGSESTFRARISASSSSAQGLFQFTGPTWSYLLKELGLNYTMDDRNDPEKSAYVAGVYVNRVQRSMSRVLGRTPSYGETYVGYFLGPTGGARFMQAAVASPDSVPDSSFDKARKANPGIFMEGGTPRTFRQILGQLEGKTQSYAAESKMNANTQEAPPVVTPTSQVSKPATAAMAAALTAKARPSTSAVSTPSASVTSQRREVRKPVPPPKVIPKHKTTSARSATKASPTAHPDNVHSTWVRGKDGRLYEIKEK